MMGRLILATTLAFVLFGCGSREPEPQPAAGPDNAEQQVTGKLEGGIMAIGGETTGWVLRRASEPDLEVDVSAVAAQAEQLQGQNVTVHGLVASRGYVERGPTPVLVAREIRPANP